MTPEQILDFSRQAIIALIAVSLPLLIVSLVIGLAVSLVQALTQIQEVTLTFVPKIIAVMISLLIFLPFMGRQLHSLFLNIIDRVISIG